MCCFQTFSKIISVSCFLFAVVVSSTEYEYEDYKSDEHDGLLIDHGDPNDNITETEERENLPGFGTAHFFYPIPNTGTVVAAHCGWQFRYNFVENRIPRETPQSWKFILVQPGTK